MRCIQLSTSCIVCSSVNVGGCLYCAIAVSCFIFLGALDIVNSYCSTVVHSVFVSSLEAIKSALLNQKPKLWNVFKFRSVFARHLKKLDGEVACLRLRFVV